ncbi:MAG: DinB family protein [Chitinophagaceae bacterium]
MNTADLQSNLLVRMALMAWDAQNNQFKKVINSLLDDQLMKEISPGRNSGVYLLGHLIAVSDAMLPLLGWGDRLYPELEGLFITTPDKSGQSMPSVKELKEKLKTVNDALAIHIQAATVEEWLSKHNSVSTEDFAKEPHRNKLNVVVSRTNHMANHIGQLLLLS